MRKKAKTNGHKRHAPGGEAGLLNDLLEHSVEGVAVADGKGVIKFVNPAMVRLWGHSEEHWGSIRDLAEQVFPDRETRNHALQSWAEDTKAVDPPPRVFMLTNANGEQRYCRFRMSRMGSGDIVINGQDITEYVIAQNTVQESESQFRTLAEHSPNMIFINQGGKIVYVNKRCEEVTGYTKKELCSDDFVYLALVAPEYHARTRRNFDRHMKGVEVPPYEYDIMTRTGRRINAWIATKLIPYNGRSAILGIVADISSLKRTQTKLAHSQRELRRQKKELEEKNTAMRHMLAEIEAQKREMMLRITTNIEDLLMPAIVKLRKDATTIEQRHLDVLQKDVEELTSHFGLQLSRASTSLSPRETEVCNLIRSGMTSKEMAQLLGVSPPTIHTLRNRIRRKLGLCGAGINLISHLQSLSRETGEPLPGLRSNR